MVSALRVGGVVVELVARGGRSVDAGGGGDANAVAAVCGSGGSGEGWSLFGVGVDGDGVVDLLNRLTELFSQSENRQA